MNFTVTKITRILIERSRRASFTCCHREISVWTARIVYTFRFREKQTPPRHVCVRHERRIVRVYKRSEIKIRWIQLRQTRMRHNRIRLGGADRACRMIGARELRHAPRRVVIPAWRSRCVQLHECNPFLPRLRIGHVLAGADLIVHAPLYIREPRSPAGVHARAITARKSRCRGSRIIRLLRRFLSAGHLGAPCLIAREIKRPSRSSPGTPIKVSRCGSLRARRDIVVHFFRLPGRPIVPVHGDLSARPRARVSPTLSQMTARACGFNYRNGACVLGGDHTVRE